MRYSTNKDIDRLVRDLVAAGWSIVRGGRHQKLVSPGGRRIPFPGTPSDRRSVDNMRCAIRRIVQSEMVDNHG